MTDIDERLVNRINLIKTSIDTYKDDGLEYIPISTVEYFIGTIEKEINDD